MDTSSGMINIMRKEKYQVMRTARVTRTGCLIQLEYLEIISNMLKVNTLDSRPPYLHNKAAARISATHTSVRNIEYAIVARLVNDAWLYWLYLVFSIFISSLKKQIQNVVVRQLYSPGD